MGCGDSQHQIHADPAAALQEILGTHLVGVLVQVTAVADVTQ